VIPTDIADGVKSPKSSNSGASVAPMRLRVEVGMELCSQTRRFTDAAEKE